MKSKPLLIFLIIVFWFIFVYKMSKQVFVIQSVSMEDTLFAGDFILITDSKTLMRGNIAVFKSNRSENRIVKRIIGIPGDTLYTSNYDEIYLNKLMYDHRIDNKYINLVSSGDETYLNKLVSKDLIYDKFRNQISAKYDEKTGFTIKSQIGEPILVNDTIILSNNYYVMGDNRKYSFDSRNFGPVSGEKFLGKVVLVLFNFRKGKFSWDRILKKIS